jgi:hypothetical protein
LVLEGFESDFIDEVLFLDGSFAVKCSVEVEEVGSMGL